MREIDIKEFASLNVRLAKAAGVNAALVHAKIAYYLKINIANNTNLRDGKHWVRFTAEEIQDLLPCLTVKQVRTAIDKLKQRNAIIVGESHYNGPFRTTWYTIPDNILNKAYPKNINPSVTSRELVSDTEGISQFPQGKSNTSRRLSKKTIVEKEEKESNSIVIKEKEHFCSPAEYHKWKATLLNNLRLDKTTYDAIQSLVAKYGEEEVQEYLHYWQKDGEKYHSTTELLDKVESDLRWKHRPQFYK